MTRVNREKSCTECTLHFTPPASEFFISSFYMRIGPGLCQINVSGYKISLVKFYINTNAARLSRERIHQVWVTLKLCIVSTTPNPPFHQGLLLEVGIQPFHQPATIPSPVMLTLAIQALDSGDGISNVNAIVI